jgi:N-ethylmaleimide reductase
MTLLALPSQFKLGDLTLKNRVVMAPMTRCRADGHVPNALMAEYYAQRAGAGLQVTEGTSPSPNGLGYARIPGCYSVEQVRGWRLTTDAVHALGGRIFVQLMHTGRVSHPFNMPDGARVLAPSAVALEGEMWTDQAQNQSYPVPNPMTRDDIRQTVAEYAQSAQCAMDAGFDGVELHGANGYLIEQFLNPASNQRQDDYGGSWEHRLRFATEVAEATVARIGGARVGIRLSPYGAFNGMSVSYDGIEDMYAALATRLRDLGLAYLHIVDHSSMGAPTVPKSLKQTLRELFGNAVILSGGYDAERAERDLVEGRADLVAFGRPFMANPNLAEKLQRGAGLVQPDMATAYTPGPKGYTDYAA